MISRPARRNTNATTEQSLDFGVYGAVTREHGVALRSLVPAAFGFGSDARDTVRHRYSRRGAIVKLPPLVTEALSDEESNAHVEYGITIAPHHLSSDGVAMQAIIPILTGFDATHEHEILVKRHKGTVWLEVLGSEAKSAVVMVPETLHLRNREVTLTSYTVDPDTLLKIETALLIRLTM